jgi:hypothetical protein
MKVFAQRSWPVLLAAAGLTARANGWWILPNRILLRGQRPDVTSLKRVRGLLGGSAFRQLGAELHLLLLTVVSVAALGIQLARRRGFWRVGVPLNVLFLATTFLHLQFARVGWFLRFEAYLMVLGFVAAAVGLVEWTIPDTLQCGDETVPFYAADPDEAPRPAAALGRAVKQGDTPCSTADSDAAGSRLARCRLAVG